MRIAVVSDIHGNRAALEAVVADLRETSPELILHGGDLAAGGSSAAWVVDYIRDLGWPGVVGNTDQLLFQPESLTRFAAESPGLQPMWTAIQEQADATREALGEERLAWLAALPFTQVFSPVALVHAKPDDLWRAPAAEAPSAELEQIYGRLGEPVAIYAHTHQAFVRELAGLTVANTGSTSLSYDGDCRAAYLLIDDTGLVVRRVPYDVQTEIKALSLSSFPHSEWIARMLTTARPQLLL